MELNREQIIKALECCNGEHYCSSCPYYGNCYDGKVTENALALIKELAEENEGLRAEAENQSVLWKNHFDSIYETAKETVKSDTVRKMQELIYERLDISVEGYSSEEIKSDVRDMVYQIAKEMLEGQDDKT